jgi:serine/threonine-protein kinase HipA
VGHLSELPGGGAEFRFLDAYHEMLPRPVLGQKFEDDLERVHRNRPGQGLPDFFANLIPEGRLREVIEASAGTEGGDDLALLAFVGRDLPGAVEVRPVGEEQAQLFPEKPSEPTPQPEEGEAPKEGLRFSLAGVQMKFSMLREAEKLTLPARGRSGEWIVKFDSPSFPHLPENEGSMLAWARQAGFDVPEHHLHTVEQVVGFPRGFAPPGTRVLAIRRYDRGTEGRIHQEDFAQVVGLPPKKKYEQITHEVMARLVRRFMDEAAAGELVRRLVFVIASGNNDAHLKNWSLIYPDQIRASWSPLYDQVATIAWEGPDRALALKLAGAKDFDRLDRAAFQRFAAKAEMDERRVRELIETTLEHLRRTWREIAAGLPLPRAHAEALREHWRRVPLLRAVGPLE